MKIEFDGHSTFVGQGGVHWAKELPTLVLVHGAGLNHTVWVLLGRYFARHGYNLLIPDLPGHGDSAGVALASIKQNGQWLNSLVQSVCTQHAELQSQNIVYCGHSMGSLVAMEAASTALESVSNLLLLGTAMPMVVGKPLLDAARDNDHAAIDMINMFGHSFGSRIGNNPISGINVYNCMEALLESAPSGVLYNDLNACNEYLAGIDAASRLNGHTRATVVSGDSDRMTAPTMAKQAQQALGAELITLTDCGHMMMSEQPEATLQAIKAALA